MLQKPSALEVIFRTIVFEDLFGRPCSVSWFTCPIDPDPENWGLFGI